MDQNAQGRRPHYQRGRRGQDRRGNDRRTPPSQAPQSAEAGGRESRELVDVEQIMREIRARIAKGSGVDVTNQQIHELAARRLEALLDPRTIKPALLEQLRRGAAASELPPTPSPPPLEVQEESLFDSFMRRLLRPLFATLAPILQAFKTQDSINNEAVAREAAANRRQAEWNALQFELLQRMVAETARVSIEMQSLGLRIDSLGAKVEFNERRVRTMENTAPPARSPARQHESAYIPPAREMPAYQPPGPTAAAPSNAPAPAAAPAAPPGDASSDPARKRRRRRRGRRSGAGQTSAGFAAEAGDPLMASTGDGAESGDTDSEADLDADEPVDDEPPMPATVEAAPPVVAAPPPQPEPAPAPPPEPTPAPALESRTVWQQVTSAPTPAPVPEQPMPPRDEALPQPDTAPPLEPPDPGRADR